MVDSPLAVKDLNRLNGSLYLTQQLNGGTALGKELAAGAIWKVRMCACAAQIPNIAAFLLMHDDGTAVLK
jgi:hypothetical protein